MEYSGNKRITLIFCMVIFTVCFYPIKFSLANEKGGVFNNLSSNETELELKRLDIQICSWNQIVNVPLKSLLVAQNWIAFGTVDNSVGILDMDGQPIIAFHFDARGGDYKLYFDSEVDCVVLKIDRSIAAITIDLEGNIQKIDESYDTEKALQDSLGIKRNMSGIGYRLDNNGNWINEMLNYKTQIVKLEGGTKKYFMTTAKWNF